jgi:hypothetical protein
MKMYRVRFKFSTYLYQDVMAESEDDAIDKSDSAEAKYSHETEPEVLNVSDMRCERGERDENC